MGIKNLNSVLKHYNTFPKTQIKYLNSSIIGVDFSLFLYRFIYNQNNPIECFLRQIQMFFKYNILPVYVLDGNAPEEKDTTLEKRAYKRQKIYQEIQKLQEQKNNSENNNYLINLQIKKLEKKCVLFSNDLINDILYFFHIIGVPVIQENYESDWILAQLNKNNLIDYILSEDSDLLTFGANRVLKNFSIREETCQIYSIHSILKHLNITKNQFIDMCILCGCDYSPKVKGMNCPKSFQLISNHKNAENIQKLNEYNHINLQNIQKARDIFKKEITNDLLLILKPQICKKEFQINEIQSFLNKHLEKKYLIPIFIHYCNKTNFT